MVKKIADYITKYCYTVFVIFLVLAGVCGLLSLKVNVNHNIYSYMPADSETSKGLKIMQDEFDYGSTSSWQMMFEDLPEDKREETKTYIEGVENIKSVAYDNTENYQREHDGHSYSLYDITLNAPADSEIANKTYNEIDQHFKGTYKYYTAGEVSSNNGSVVSIAVTAIAIGCAMLILTIMSESFLEPWLYLFAILIAVLLNKGTNIMFENVSHITDSISMVLQMALSMDYAIMLSSRYRQEKAGKDHPNKATAMNRALRYSFGAILSSSVTTIVGLIILIFMSFTIGRDMGLVLSKGVLLSLVSIFTTLPALLLLFDKAIEKTHKRTITPKLKWLGNFEFNFKKLALPVFALIFGAAFFLKGNAGILFTGSENNYIKDVFPVVNQTALVYRNSDEDKLRDFCNTYADKAEVSRILCYSNTIAEPEKYNEIVAKANELGQISVSGQGASNAKTISVEDYLVKTLYYYYYRGDEHEVTLPELARFLRDDVLPDERFSEDISGSKRSDVERLIKFLLPEEAAAPRSRDELASLLEVEPETLDELFVLYLSEHPTPIRLTLLEFARFTNSNVLTNPDYAKLVSHDKQLYLEKLLTLADSNATNKVMSPAELASVFGLEQNDVEKVLTYYNYVKSAEPSISVKPEALLNFALTNERVLSELKITAEQATNILDGAKQLHSKVLPYLNETPFFAKVTSYVDKTYSFNDFQGLYNTIKSYEPKLREEAEALKAKYNIEIDLDALIFNNIAIYEKQADDYVGKLKQVYQLYQTYSLPLEATPEQFINFLSEHANDELLGLSPDRINLISLASTVVNNQEKRYSYTELADTFGLNSDDLKLVYALYDYRYITGDPGLSLNQVVDFLTNTVFTSPRFSDRIDEAKKSKVRSVDSLMSAARAGTMYDYRELHFALSSLSGDIDKNQLAMLYLYHGSLYDYDESWTMTLESFVDFLNDSVIFDKKFDSRIDDTRRTDVINAKKTISDAKALLVGPNYSRALIETGMAAEGKETFAFLKGIKDDLVGLTAKTDYFLVGDSAMAYEMSQSFSSEMDFITILTMAAIFIVVAFTFRSILIPLLLVFVIQAAVYIIMAYLSISGQSIYFIALIIVQAILMGATIDYAILFASYYIEHRKHFNLDIREALIASYTKSIHSILTSASILILVTAIVGNMASAIAAKICQSISGGTLVATIIILFILPALLATIDKFIIKKKQ